MVAPPKPKKLKKGQLDQTRQAFEKVCLTFGCKAVVLTSAESGYGIPQLQAILDAAVAGAPGEGEQTNGL